MSSFQPSTRFGDWLLNLKLARGVVRRKAWAAWAQVLGDTTQDWLIQGLLEHLPSYASPTSVGLMASERQLDTYPGEPSAQIAAREPYAIQISRFYDRALGLLLGLHFAGFDNAIIVTQNGLAFQLSLPLPAFADAWDPTPNQVITQLGVLATPLHSSVNLARSIPSGNSWWTFDSDTDFCSRFAVLFYGAAASQFTTWGIATFDGAQDGTVAHPWPTVTWNNAFPDTTYKIIAGGVTSDAPVIVQADGTTKTTTGVQTISSAPFTGTVDFLAYQSGANPFADPHPADLARLRAVIAKWRAAKATCVSISVAAQGRFWGWPVRTWGSQGIWQPSTVLALSS